MRNDIEKKFPLPKAIAYVLLSVVVVWGTLFVSWWYHDYTMSERTKDKAFTIQGIVSSCPGPDFLSSKQLATLLGLATKEPQNLYLFDPHNAERIFKGFPAIKTSSISRLRPNAVFIRYELRKPFVQLVEFENTALDSDGYPFPLFPVYSPKRLPEVYLGLAQISWNEPIATEEFRVACELLHYLEEVLPKTVRVTRIDTHNIKSPSRGRQEIVVVLDKYYLRLHATDYKKNIKQFLALLPTLKTMNENKQQIIDLRLSGFALVK